MNDNSVNKDSLHTANGIANPHERIVMLCDGCTYRYGYFEHLNGYDGIDKWINCTCPSPFWVISKAMPDIPATKGVCKTYLAA